MKTRAAVAFEARQSLEIVEVDRQGPRAGEVQVGDLPGDSLEQRRLTPL